MPASVPSPGPTLDFVAWTAVLVERLRELLPAIAAARRGESAVLRHRDRQACIARDDDLWWATFRQDDGRPTLPGIWFEQLDAAGIAVMVKNLAGFFDAELSRPER